MTDVRRAMDQAWIMGYNGGPQQIAVVQAVRAWDAGDQDDAYRIMSEVGMEDESDWNEIMDVAGGWE